MLYQNSLDNLKKQVKSALDFEGELDDALLQKLVSDPLFKHHFIICKSNPKMLSLLLQSTLKKQYLNEGVSEHSTGELIKHGLEALAHWGRSGFSTVSDEVYVQRMAACRVCPHHVDAPNHAIYKFSSLGLKDDKICSLCGCNVARKARLTTEKCPSASLENPEISRWGEKIIEHEEG
ncbi:hypothetical protein IQ223_19230 [Microcystis aeruginosa LEGE 00239]|uniref:hypothetical protein n=1 Tax=Microcystis aeruginosa TaxID=1126 RepID=UPI00187F0F4B|nr:hypothetical protein [Microcystis aeruginosa]MBE9246549.1 hypothetical protein [Microcystis aeruginosa LEGE 00239]